MANRTIELTLKADVGRLVAGLKTARDSVNAAGRDVAGFVRNNERDLQTFGTALTTAGAGLTAMAVGAVKAAIDWESAWAGVQKTNDGTAEQMTRLEEDLRNLAKTLPASHAEIAEVAEAAGQLGVSVDDVADFTLTMINMGETTNLSAEEAATGIARFSNVMGTAWSDADRLGSTIVGLGNNFATTEAEILHMSQRIAPVGRVMNMTEADVLSMATAMSSVGIEAEAGGTAISMVMRKIDAAVRDGGSSLNSWAEAAGVSAQEFATAWQERPAEAMQILSAGLGETANAGGDVSAILSELGVKGIRESATMLSLASASGLLAESLDLGAQAWDENSALAEEAEVRYATAEARISIAWNNIKDAAITAGASIAPTVGDIADVVADLANWFGQLPAPVLGAVTALSGVGGVTALAAGGLMLLAPRAVETWDAMKRLNAAAKNLPPSLRSVGRYASLAAVAFTGFTVMREVANNMQQGTASVEDMTAALIELNNQSDITAFDEVFSAEGLGPFGREVDGLAESLAALDPSTPAQHLASFGHTVMGLDNTAGQTAKSFKTLDEALVGMSAEDAAASMRNLREEAEAAGRQDFSSWEDLQRVLPEYAASIQEMANATGEAYSDAELLEMAMGNLPPVMQQAKEAADQAAQQDQLQGALEDVGLAADGAVESLSEYLEMLFATGLANQTAMQASASYEEALDSVSDSVKTINEDLGGMGKVFDKTTGLFNTSSEAGREAQSAFLDVADSGMNLAEAMAAAGESQDDVQDSLQGTYDDLIATAGEFGITGEAAENLARHVLGIPDGVDIETWMDQTAQETVDELSESMDAIPEGLSIITEMDDNARQKAFETGEAVEAIPGYKKVDVAVSEDGTAGQVQSKVDSITGKTEYVFVSDDGTTTKVQQQIINIDGVTRHVYVDDNGTVYATQQQIDGITDGSSFISVTDNSADANSRINNAARNREALITIKTTQIGGGNFNSVGRTTGQQRALGGRAPTTGLTGRADGGRLPYTGLGTDQILGINSMGTPLAWVDDLEWIINRRSSDKYDSVLDRINRDHPSVHHLAHLRDGGRAGQLASTAVAMSPNISVAAPPVDTAAIGAAVASAIRSYQPVVNIGGHRFAGVMKEVQQQYVARR